MLTNLHCNIVVCPNYCWNVLVELDIEYEYGFTMRIRIHDFVANVTHFYNRYPAVNFPAHVPKATCTLESLWKARFTDETSNVNASARSVMSKVTSRLDMPWSPPDKISITGSSASKVYLVMVPTNCDNIRLQTEQLSSTSTWTNLVSTPN